MPNLQVLQDFLDESVRNGSSFCWAAATVTKDKVYPTQVAGMADPATSAPLKPDSIYWIASAAKIVLAVALFSAIEQGHIEGVTMDNAFDDPESVTRFCPELAVGSGHGFMKIWQGWEDEDARKPNPYKDAKKPVTLRHLLTWTSGSTGPFFARYLHLMRDKGPNEKTLLDPDLCHIDSLSEPRFTEAGAPDSFGYGGAANDWIGVYLARATKMSQRQAIQKYIAQPLNLSPEDFNHYLTPAMRKRKVAIHVETPNGYQAIPLEATCASWEGDVPEGYHEYGNAGIYGTIGAFATFLQAVLKMDERLLSKKTWEYTRQDDLARRSFDKVILPEALWTDAVPHATKTVRGENSDMGTTLLQAMYERKPTSYGLTVASLHWYGLANLSWFVDFQTGLAGVITTQTLPFWGDKEVATHRAYIKKAYEVFAQDKQ